MRLKITVLVMVLSVFLFILTACSSEQPAQPVVPQPQLVAQPEALPADPAVQEPITETQPSPPQPAPEAAEPTSESNVKEFTITAKQWEFDIKEIRVKKGDRVKIHVKSFDVRHGFFIPQYNVNENQIKPGQDADIEFVASREGTWAYFCSVPCGKGHKDMRGNLIVE